MKVCSKCKINKNKSEFAFQNKSENKLMPACKDCSNLKQRINRQDNLEKIRTNDKKNYLKNRDKRIKAVKEYRIKYPDRTRNTNLKVKYGITQEGYLVLKGKQDGKCAICNTHQDNLKRILCVDHCHINNKVRGLLCDTCNKFLGFYEKFNKEIWLYLKGIK